MEYLRQSVDSFLTNSIQPSWGEWSATTTYDTETDPENLTDGAVARYGNYYYRTITDSNLNNNPEDTLGIEWIRWEVSNRFALIDLRSSTLSETTTGADSVTNGLFTTDTDWTKDTGWTITGNAAVCDGTADARIYQDAGIIIDNRFEFSIDVSVYTSGDVHVAYHDGTSLVQVSADISATGVVTGDFTTYYTANPEIYIVAGTSGFVGSINEFTLNNSGDLIITFPKGIIDTLAIGHYTCSDLIIELLDDEGTTLWSETEEQSPNELVEDYYSYIYSEYTLEVDRGKTIQLPSAVGVNIRVTFTVETVTATASCGFLVADEASDMGETLFGVAFSFRSYSVKATDAFGITQITKRGIQDLVDFETLIDSAVMATQKRKLKTIYDEVVAFIVDPSADSKYDNLVTLGTVDNVSILLSNPQKTTIAWSIQEIL